jgi:hypothetical protein
MQFLVLLSDSEEEAGPRLKPVFVRKDRVTVMEKERKALCQKQAEIEAKKMAEEHHKYTLKVPRFFRYCMKLSYLCTSDFVKTGRVGTSQE